MASFTKIAQDHGGVTATGTVSKMLELAPVDGFELPDFQLPTLTFVGPDDYVLGLRTPMKNAKLSEVSQCTIMRSRLDHSMGVEVDEQDESWGDWSFS
mmetsp:Transcript_21498/g.35412  ORF Transcript_21498/g.35412 Transcript_21498/m.35412 type:complete len:98 (+) Transcript_21498:85-378(+)